MSLNSGRTRRQSGLADLMAGEDGMVSLVTVVAVVFGVVLIGLVFNVGTIVIQKIEVQGAADAVAESSAVVSARGMNSITATNHLMGEVMSLVVLHEAVGGKKLESGETNPTSGPDGQLRE